MPSVEQLPGKHQKGVGSFREDNDFADMTLACEDGQQVEAHKVILAASSPFFQTLLGRIKHPHPLIYMRGMRSDNLLAILDFLYCGEANVFQENLDSFLAVAEELQLKGLMGKHMKRSMILKMKHFLLPSTQIQRAIISRKRNPAVKFRILVKIEH